MRKSNSNYVYQEENSYIHPILINREIEINDNVSRINDLFVELIPKVNVIYQRSLPTVFGEKEEFYCVEDLELMGEAIIEYIGLKNNINIKKIKILEEEYIKLPFPVKQEDIRGKVVSKFIYNKGGGEVYISIYYMIYFNDI